MTVTVGIDLAADPKGTAIATIQWSPSHASVMGLTVGADDDLVMHWMCHPDGAIGIDCPFGWPVKFSELISANATSRPHLPTSLEPGWRREYVLRATDRWVQDVTGLRPLSVSADRIGHVALRFAAIRAQSHQLAPEPLDGSGTIAEVYPAAALKFWGLPYRSYKRAGGDTVRSQLVDGLRAAAPWLDLGEHERAMRASDDALDAVICALVARAKRLGRTARPEVAEPGDEDLAQLEGWIHLPECALEELL